MIPPQVFPPADGDLRPMQLLDAFRYWAAQWWKFNLAVGLAGLLPMAFHFRADLSSWFYASPYIAVWAVMGNGLYTVGYTLESVAIGKTNLGGMFRNVRTLLFLLGTVGFALATAFVSYFEFMHFQLPD